MSDINSTPVLSKALVILVNDRDEWIGTADKLTVHQTGALHRALSVFITNSQGELLIQRRAVEKYHSGGLWSNACCSHPAPGEPTPSAARRRLREEMGIDMIPVPVSRILYRAPVGNGLTEHEYDHIFTGIWDGDIAPNPEEVCDYAWITQDALDEWMTREPGAFTAWFPILLQAWRTGTRSIVAQPA